MPNVIVALSGGKASAWCADWAFKNFDRDSITLYFNDTKSEHWDLYRFINDLSRYFDHPIVIDSDGRNLEQLFIDEHAIANNRMPFCSRILKADRLQKYYHDDDIIIFGIGPEEQERENGLIGIYSKTGAKRKAWANLIFPMIDNNISQRQVDEFIQSTGIKQPLLYDLGFKHNNCSGGCVRAGKKHWKLLYESLPEVYLDRERMEEDFMKRFKKRATIFKTESLKEFRHRIDNNLLSSYYDTSDKNTPSECIGVCDTMS